LGKEEKKSTPKPAPYVSKRQLSKHEREKRLIQIALGTCAVFAVIIVAVLGVGVWKELHRGEDPVVTVNGHAITAETFAKVVGFRTASLDAAMNQYQSYVNSMDPSNPDNAYLIQSLNQELSLFAQQKGMIEQTVLNDLVNYEFVKVEAAKRGITVSQDEINRNIYSVFGDFATQTAEEGNATPAAGAAAASTAATTPVPTATQGSTSTPASTPAPTATPAGTPTPYPTPAPLTQDQTDKAKQNLKTSLTQIGGYMTETDYVELIAKPEILNYKVQEALGKEVPTSAEQVDVAHILVATKEEADDIMNQLKNGADFATLAKEKSTDPGTKENGGDLGWFTRGTMLADFEDAAFKTKPGELYSEIVSTPYGYHILKGIGHDANRPLDATQLAQAQEAAMTKWLGDQQTQPGAVTYAFGSETVSWERAYVANYQKISLKNSTEAATKTATAQPKTTATPVPAAATPAAATPAN
jgi:parvulin-like peptidyl-prolyl isomerase